jgi:hypothetical protein
MKINKIALLIAAFAALAGPVAGARAATETSVNFVTPDDSGGADDLNLFFHFASPATDGDWVSGDGFIDQFLFSVPEAARISFDTIAHSGTGGPELSFTGFELMPANGDPVAYAFENPTVAASFMAGTGLTLATGTYDLVLSGTFLTGDAAYGGTLVATSAVPEPGSWFLLLGGIAAVAALAHRRGAKRRR